MRALMRPRVALGAGVLVLSGAAHYLRRYPAIAFLIWLLALATALWMGASLKSRASPAETLKHQLGRLARRIGTAGGITLILLVCLGASLRCIGLEKVPPYMDADEGRQGIHALSLFKSFEGKPTGFPVVLALGWNWLPNLSYLVLSSFVLPFGNTIHNLRLSSAVVGSLSILFLYLFAREFWGPVVACLAVSFMVFGRNHIEWSRIGTSNIQAALAILVSWWFLARAMRRQSVANWLYCGIAVGVGLHLYHAAKVVPIIVFAYVLLLWATGGAARSFLCKASVAFVFGAAVAFLPLGLWYREHWASVSSSLNDRTLQDDLYYLIRSGAYGRVFSLMWVQTRDSVLGLFLKPGTLPFGYGGPMVDPFTAVAALPGFLLVARRPLRADHLLILCWLFLTLLFGSVLTINPPHHPRLVGLFPCLYLLAGIGCHWVLKVTRDRILVVQWAGVGLVAVLVAAAAVINTKNYFVDFPRLRPSQAGFGLARYVSRLPADSHITSWGSDDSTEWRYPNIQFAAWGRRIRGESPDNLWTSVPLARSPSPVEVFVLEGSSLAWIDLLREIYPNGMELELAPKHLSRARPVRAYQLTAQAVEERQGLDLCSQDQPQSCIQARDLAAIGNGVNRRLGSERMELRGSWFIPTSGVYEWSPGGGIHLVKLGGRLLGSDPAPDSTPLAFRLVAGWHPIQIDFDANVPAGPLRLPKTRARTEDAARAVEVTSRWRGNGLLLTVYPGKLAFGELSTATVLYKTLTPLVSFRVRPEGNDPLTRWNLPLTLHWMGVLRIPTRGEYQFELAADGGGIVNLAAAHSATSQGSGNVEALRRTFSPGEAVVIEVLCHLWPAAHPEVRQCGLFWTPPGGKKELVPNHNLELPASYPPDASAGGS